MVTVMNERILAWSVSLMAFNTNAVKMSVGVDCRSVVESRF